MNTRTLILAILLLPGLAAFSQPYYFRHFQVENGLSNNAVICSLQDKKGFMWFGTKDGLDRFDGYSFKVFLGSNFIHCLWEDRDGILWVGTETGLYRHDALTESFTALPGASSGSIRDIMTDNRGNLWYISGFTLFKYDMHGGRSELYNTDTWFEATSICLAGDSSVWVSTSTGSLKKYDPVHNSFKSFDLFDHSPKTLNNWIEKIYPVSGKGILVGTAIHGAKLFDICSAAYNDILTYNPDGTEIFARNFIQTSPAEYWIATETGIFIYDSRTRQITNLRKKYNDPYSISDNAVYTFCRDREGGIWAGTYFGGVNYYPRQYNSFKKYFPKSGENSVSGSIVREIHQDRQGDLWVGTEDAGLDKYDTATGIFTHFEPTGRPGSISYSNIHGLLVDHDKLWIGTFEHGLDCMDLRSEEVIRHYAAGEGEHDLKSNFIYCLYRSADSAIWVGTTRGAYKYEPAKDHFTPLPGLGINVWYSSLLQDSSGVTWAGTYGFGVYRYDPHTGQTINFKFDSTDGNSLSSDRINSIFLDSRKRLWFATEGGLCCYQPDSHGFRRYTTQEGLPTNFILSLLEDNNGKLWISTSRGLVRLDPVTGKINVYTRINGLLNDQFNFSSAFKEPSGRMYFGSVKGMISFHPDEFTGNAFIPPVYITGFQIDNADVTIGKKGSILQRSISYTEKITLKHNQSTFSIDFAALSYTAPEMAEYAYKMEGLDKDWTLLKTNRKAYFTELSPGTYTFRVKASNSSGLWNERETILQIEVLPPWWASPLAWCCYILAAILAIYHLIRSYHQRVEESNRRKIEHLEAAKEKEIFNAKIEFFTNVAHEIRTPLTLIKGPLEKVVRRAGDQPEIKDSLRIMERNTNRLIDLTNQLLDFRQTEIKGFSLNFVRADVAAMLEDMYVNFRPLAEQKQLLFDLDIPADGLLAYIDTEAFSKILSNLFSNALKYADKKVLVRLLPLLDNDDHFTIEIMNDGYLIPFDMREKIFEPFYRLKETEKQKGTGIGLALSRSLTQLHKGTLELRQSRHNMNTFFLSLPIHQNNEFDL